MPYAARDVEDHLDRLKSFLDKNVKITLNIVSSSIMSSYILKLRELINNPEQLDDKLEWIALDDSTLPTLLIYGEKLGLEALKNPNFKPGDLLQYWKVLSKASEGDLTAIEVYFERAPTILHGEKHFVARRFFAPTYRRMESELPNWLATFTEDFFSLYNNHDQISPIAFAREYIQKFSRRIIAQDINVEAHELPDMPGEILQMITTLKILKAYDQRLNTLVEFIQSKLKLDGRDPDEAWSIVSTTVMGTEPLLSALVYALVLPTNDLVSFDAEKLMNESKPICVLGREAVRDFEIGGMVFKKGQRVQVTTDLIRSPSINQKPIPPPIPFGIGVHICPGKKLSLMVAEVFLKRWVNAKDMHHKLNKVKFFRDFVLRPRETA